MHGREVEAARENFHQLLAVVSNAAACPAKRKRWTDDDREADLSREFEAIFEIINERGFRHVEADALHGIFEEEPVFGLLNGTDLRADQMHVVLFEHSSVGKFDGKVERGLPADRGEHGESGAGRHFALDADDLF